MTRTWAVLLTITALAGCRSAQPITNPFLRTTVPPPATGPAVVVPGQPFTPGAVAPGVAPPVVAPGSPVAPAVIAPPGTPPVVAPPGDKYAPPGGFQYQQGSVNPARPVASTSQVTLATYQQPAAKQSAAPQPAPAVRAQATPTVSTPAMPSGTPGNEIRILPPRSGASKEAAAAREASAPSSSASGVVRVTADNDQASTATDTSLEADADRDDESRGGSPLAVATPEVGSESDDNEVESAEATSASPARETVSPRADPAGYAFAPDYSWLRGSLEYSQSSHQWKLRYIPIDGETDQFGGSVKLPPSDALAAFKAGDMVAVRGSVAAGPSVSGSYAPVYQLAHIEPAAR